MSYWLGKTSAPREELSRPSVLERRDPILSSCLDNYLGAGEHPPVLNPRSPLPLYQQLAEQLRQEIEQGGLSPGTRLPSEPELSRRHRIGRPTVRQATELLVRRGLIERRRGAGTFVRQAPPRVDLFSLGGTLSSFRQGGVELCTRILGKPLERRVARDLENPFSEQHAYVVTRVSSVGERPVLLEHLYFSPELFPGLSRFSLSGVSLSKLVEEQYYLRPTHAEQSFRVAAPTPLVRRALKLGMRSALLLVKRALSFPEAPRAVFVELYCRTDELIFSQTIGAEAEHD
jgi:GntR family transcriptional regulator